MKKITIITTAVAFVIAGLVTYIKKMKFFKGEKS